MEYTDVVKDMKINYYSTGHGNCVVLLHGWGCDLNIFSKIHYHLEKYFKVYSIDLPGFGKSEEPDEVWGVEEYTSIIEEFLKLKNIYNPILIGHSFGGRISILFASRNPVNKLVLIDTAGVKPKRKLKYYLKIFSYKIIKHILKLFYKPDKFKVILEKFKKKSGSSDYRNASDQMRKILSKIVNEDLKYIMFKIKAPTLLIWGENDIETPVKDAKIIETLIPNVGLVILKNAGHYSFIEKMNDFIIILNNFLKVDKNK